MAAAVLGRTAAARTPRAEVGMRFSPVGWKAGARDSGVESPDVEVLDARAAVGMASAAAQIVHGCALRQHDGQPARPVFWPAPSAGEELVVGVSQGRDAAQRLTGQRCPRSQRRPTRSPWPQPRSQSRTPGTADRRSDLVVDPAADASPEGVFCAAGSPRLFAAIKYFVVC